MHRTVLTTGLVLVMSSANASFIDGNKLHEWCVSNQNLVSAYVAGVFDQTQTAEFQNEIVRGVLKDKLDALSKAILAGASKAACIPERVTITQVRDIVCRYIAINPDNRHGPASTQAHMAMIKAYPCKR